MRGGAPLVLHRSIDQDRVLAGLAVLSDHPRTAPRPAPCSPAAWRAIAAAFGLSMALVFLPFGALAAMAAFAAGTCLAGFFVAGQGRTRIAAGLLAHREHRSAGPHTVRIRLHPGTQGPSCRHRRQPVDP
ncbi:hypothetical protein [Streptomyces xanthophaeus]